MSQNILAKLKAYPREKKEKEKEKKHNRDNNYLFPLDLQAQKRKNEKKKPNNLPLKISKTISDKEGNRFKWL